MLENSFVSFLAAFAVCVVAFILFDWAMMGLQGLSLLYHP
jgi:hypothetical protein